VTPVLNAECERVLLLARVVEREASYFLITLPMVGSRFTSQISRRFTTSGFGVGLIAKPADHQSFDGPNGP
jgi:hypothetical protein